MKLLWLCLLYLVGVVIGGSLQLSWWLLLTCLLPLPLIICPRIRKSALWGSVGLFALSFGLIFPSFATLGPGQDTLAEHNNSGVATVRAVIDREVEIRDSSQHLYLNCQQVKHEEALYDISSKLLVYVPRYPEYQYGDELLLTGALESPPVFTNEATGKVEFDYAAYLANQGVFSVMVYPEVQAVSAGNGNLFLAGLYNFKHRLALSLESALPEPESSLACGVFLGERHKIPLDIQNDFSRAGAFHLLAISGFHLGIIAAIALGLGRMLLGKQGYFYIILAMIIVWLYAVIAGSGPPVIRAAIMASIFLLAELLGRQKNSLPALALAASIMVAVDPKIINTASFQMSFSAMAGIMLFYPSFRSLGQQALLHLLGERRKAVAVLGVVNDSLAVSLAATIFVLPLTLHYFGVFSPLGPLVTLLLAPALILIIVTSALVASLGFFWSAGAMVFGWLCWMLGRYMSVVTGWFSSFDTMYAENTHLSGFWVAAYYVLVLSVYLIFKAWKRWESHKTVNRQAVGQQCQSGRITSRTATCLLVVAVCALVLTIPAGCRKEERLEVSFLDVGQGDSILVSKGNTQVLIDGGPSPRKLMRELGRKMPFFDRHIEVVVLTHPHADHIDGLLEVLRRYNVSQVIYSATGDGLEGRENSALREWLSLIEDRQIPAVIARGGMYFNLGEAVFTVLSPGDCIQAGIMPDIDNNSVVLELAAGNYKFLFTGDIKRQRELELVMERKISPVNILKVAHHGSETSSCSEFLSVASPDIGVICVGDNGFGHPHDSVMGRIYSFTGDERVLRTDECKGVTFLTDGDSLWVEAGSCVK